MAGTVTYDWYRDSYGGGLPEAAFGESLPMAEAHVKWLCAVKGINTTCNLYKRAVCAACEAFAEYGAGEELATAAALRELGLSGMAFCGVC